jgi:putative heme iron utilization protein
MRTAEDHALRSLLDGQPVASLSTLHRGEPAVSMVPFALLPQGQGFVIHVSGLATHTKDMLSSPAVGLMVMALPDPEVSPLALPRLSVQGHARPCAAESPKYEQARACYLAKLPQSEDLFSFGDFSLFIIEVRSARFVAGFGRATSITAGQFAALMGE